MPPIAIDIPHKTRNECKVARPAPVRVPRSSLHPGQEVTLAAPGDLDQHRLPGISTLDENNLSVVACHGSATVRHSLGDDPSLHPSVSSRSGISPTDRATSSSPCIPAR